MSVLFNNINFLWLTFIFIYTFDEIEYKNHENEIVKAQKGRFSSV
jgi:hypothetical protein